jgi:hypothetical protein
LCILDGIDAGVAMMTSGNIKKAGIGFGWLVGAGAYGASLWQAAINNTDKADYQSLNEYNIRLYDGDMAEFVWVQAVVAVGIGLYATVATSKENYQWRAGLSTAAFIFCSAFAVAFTAGSMTGSDAAIDSNALYPTASIFCIVLSCMSAYFMSIGFSDSSNESTAKKSPPV